MREKATISFLIAVAILLLCFLGLLFYISNVEMGIDNTEEVRAPCTEAVIYSDGRMWIRERALVDPDNNLIYLPEGIEPGSLRIEDPKVSGFVEEAPETADVVYSIESEDGVLKGDFLWESDSFIALEVNEQTVAINKDRIKSYSYDYIPQPQKGVRLMYGGAIPSNVTVSYVVGGAEFDLRYLMDGAHIDAMADVMSPVNLENATLTLRAGTPSGGAVYKEIYAEAVAPVPAISSIGSMSAGREFEFYSYTINNTTLKAGSKLSLKLFEDEVRAGTFYHWADGPVERKIRINNTLKEPLPSGTLAYYDNSTWVGNAHMPYTAEGEESEITVGYSQDVRVEKNLTQTRVTKDEITYEYTIKARNTGTSTANVTIEQVLPKNSTLISTNPAADVTGNMIRWDVTLKPGEETIQTYRYRVIPRS